MFVSRVQRSTIVLTGYSANRVVNNSGFNLHKSLPAPCCGVGTVDRNAAIGGLFIAQKALGLRNLKARL